MPRNREVINKIAPSKFPRIEGKHVVVELCEIRRPVEYSPFMMPVEWTIATRWQGENGLECVMESYDALLPAMRAFESR